jgi:hypothetical protein
MGGQGKAAGSRQTTKHLIHISAQAVSFEN